MKNAKILILLFFVPFIVKAETISERVSGRILLQVEENGEAWYVYPQNNKRYFLGRPDDAFQIMRELGVGITNSDLFKIKIGLLHKIDDFLDSDGDGYSDKEEIENSYNPYGPEKFIIDNEFSKKHLGKIFLQTEKNGEAWYVNPLDGKRYFLNRPVDAYSAMRKLGLGINNVNLNKVVIGNLEVIVPEQKNQSSKEEAKTIIMSAANSLRSGTAENSKIFFTKEMHRFVDHVFLVLDPGDRLLLANMISNASHNRSESSREVFTTQVYFNGENVPHNYYVKKQEDGSWLIDNL